jgi:hypothetical protein
MKVLLIVIFALFVVGCSGVIGPDGKNYPNAYIDPETGEIIEEGEGTIGFILG